MIQVVKLKVIMIYFSIWLLSYFVKRVVGVDLRFRDFQNGGLSTFA